MNGGQFQCQALIDDEALVFQSERVCCHDDGGCLTVDCVATGPGSSARAQGIRSRPGLARAFEACHR